MARPLFIEAPQRMRAGPPALILVLLAAIWFGFCAPYIAAIEGILDDPPPHQGDW